MNKKVKFIAGMLTVVMGTSLFYGCGQASTKTSDEKEIVVWSNLMDNEVAKVDEIAQKWAKENNKKVKVVKDDSGYQEFLTAANSSKGPDMLFGLAHNNLGTFQKAGLLEEVPSDLVNRDDYVGKNIWDAVSYDGKAYGVPISMETYALFYNKDKVKTVPKTMEELITEAKAYGQNGFQFPINDFYYTAAFMQTEGGYVFGGGNGKLDVTNLGFDNEGAIKAYQFLQDLVQKDKFMPADITQDIANNTFKSGDAIFYIGGPWDVAGFKDAGVNFGVTAIPTLDGKNIKSFLGVQAAFVSSKSNNKDDSWSLMKYLIKNSGEDLYTTGNRIPVLKSELNKDTVKNNEYTQGFIAQTAYAVPMPNVSETQAIWDPVKNIQRILGGEDPKVVAKDIQKAVKDAVEVSK
ncbi:maltose ABC transporter substrate-binding protein [Clostridium paridis]|uniref:Maltodextrin-binding protein n=1 Tax=Clostridium paridis TaxID=2803863 RepID=A0A937FFM7_9CLOT|nr:maltose ABC transporter substrate-binding protein [Clostridium paridis]MBL4933110.1 maltose ABC transporter substrate-binding protein [Clostridium paridis]